MSAIEDNLPVSVELKEYQMKLHIHTDDIDGGDDALKIIEATRRKGYSCFPITSHSCRVSIAWGLDKRWLIAYREDV